MSVISKESGCQPFWNRCLHFAASGQYLSTGHFTSITTTTQSPSAIWLWTTYSSCLYFFLNMWLWFGVYRHCLNLVLKKDSYYINYLQSLGGLPALSLSCQDPVNWWWTSRAPKCVHWQALYFLFHESGECSKTRYMYARSYPGLFSLRFYSIKLGEVIKGRDYFIYF